MFTGQGFFLPPLPERRLAGSGGKIDFREMGKNFPVAEVVFPPSPENRAARPCPGSPDFQDSGDNLIFGRGDGGGETFPGAEVFLSPVAKIRCHARGKKSFPAAEVSPPLQKTGSPGNAQAGLIFRILHSRGENLIFGRGDKKPFRLRRFFFPLS